GPRGAGEAPPSPLPRNRRLRAAAMPNQNLPVAVIGAGPIGLAAAAHLVTRGETPLVFEAGPQVGHALRQCAHVRILSPWAYNVDRAAAALLEKAGWQRPPDDEIPTGGE